MSNNVKIILLMIVCGAGVMGTGFWRYQVAGKIHPSHAVIVRDRSDSVLNGCDCTIALVKRAFADPHIGAGSTITVTVTGDSATANEPKMLSSIKVPVSRQVLEGRDAVVQQREKLLSDLNTQCEKEVQTKVSPIFIAVKRATEHLRSIGCGIDSNCVVYVQSDLEETGDQQIRAAIDNRTGDKQSLPQQINNDGINIVVYGVAETSGDIVDANGKVRRLTKAHDPQRTDRIKSVWNSLFTNPEGVTFDPYCPKN